MALPKYNCLIASWTSFKHRSRDKWDISVRWEMKIITLLAITEVDWLIDSNGVSTR